MGKVYDHTRAEKSLVEARRALSRGDHDACLAALEDAHEAGHDHARVHLGVHTTWMRLAVRTGDARMALGQILPIAFAVPVSFVRRVVGA